MTINTFGSVCSGIEAASFVLKPLGVNPLWLSEIDEFPCKFLSNNYSESPNLGDMNDIPTMIKEGKIEVPDLLCGGTPCQAFSLAGWREGINDDRGQLTLKFFDILNQIDEKRIANGLGRAVCFWENVEGVLTDSDNAFGCFLSGLAGLEDPIYADSTPRIKKIKKEGKVVEEKIVSSRWPNAGILFGKTRNVAWRVLDAKYFGRPQQRKRIYVVAGGRDFNPQNVLFEMGEVFQDPYKEQLNQQASLFDFDDFEMTEISYDRSLSRVINGHDVEIFRIYTDCLYAAYGTKWNGNAAAMNGSLFVAQNGRLRRLTPLETERIMGFPDNYTFLDKCRDTNRYRATGNSWAVNVVNWILTRLHNNEQLESLSMPVTPTRHTEEYSLYLLNDFVSLQDGRHINATDMPYDIKISNLLDYIDTNADEKFYISPAGCAGILRRKKERNMCMNARLEVILNSCSQNGKL